jgi:ABC-2 type transport system ATP-binding protein
LNLTSVPATRQDVPRSLTEAALAVDRVDVCYGERTALDGCSLEVGTGAIHGLLGPNGSGKSTLISLLVGRRTPSAGAVRVHGAAPSAATRARTGVVFQEPSLDAQMTVRETMELKARLFGLKAADARRDIAALLGRMDLADRAGSATATLSGGMKRRLELARALLPRPAVVLLDEPTLALDPDSRQALWEHLLEASAAGCTLLLATNDVYEAERYCHTVTLLDRGRVVAAGAPGQLKKELRDEAVRIDWREDPAALVSALEANPGVGHVRLAGLTTHVTVDDASPFLARVFAECGDLIAGVHIEPSTLEDVYFQLVGRGISAADREERG